MANAIPMLIRCPECLKVLSEIPGVAVYKCGGCAVILRAQVDSSSGKTSSSTSTASSSKNMSDAGSLENEGTNLGKETLSASYHSGIQDQVLKAKVSGGDGELNIRHEFSENGTKNSGESEFDAGNLKKERRFRERNGAISAQHADGDEDKMFQKVINESSILLRSRSSHVNFPRRAISGFDFPARERGVSVSSEDFRSAANFMESENGAASESRSKDPNQSAKFRHPEKIDQAKILSKLDELRIELRRYFHRGASRLSSSARFEGKLPDVIFPHDEHRGGGRPHNVHSHLPVGDGAVSSHHPLHRDQHSAKISDRRSRELKCYCRPVSGGAPFVVCTRCRNLLRLPADFLLSAKRAHKLRCGACSEVLSYTFRPKDRPTAPPIKDGKSLGEVLDDEIAAAPRLAHIGEGDPVVNRSIGKSNSHGSIMEEDRGGKSSRRSSQLHRLMGYSSARFLLFNAFSSSEGSRTEHDR